MTISATQIVPRGMLLLMREFVWSAIKNVRLVLRTLTFALLVSSLICFHSTIILALKSVLMD